MIDDLIEQLTHPDPQQRRTAIIALGKSKAPEALPALSKIYTSDPDYKLRELARKAGVFIREHMPDEPTPEPEMAVAPFTTSIMSMEPDPAAPIVRRSVIRPLGAAEESATRGNGDTYRGPVRGRTYNVPKDKIERAKGYVEAALSLNIEGDNGRALKQLTQALSLNPNLVNDSYFGSIAGAVTGLGGDAAVQLIIDRGQRSEFLNAAEREKRQQRAEQHMSVATKPTTASVTFDLVIYAAILIIGPVLLTLVMVEGARSMIGNLAGMTADIDPAFVEQTMLLTGFDTGFLLLAGVIGGISGILSLLFQALLIHLVSIFMLRGVGTYRFLLTGLLALYNRWLPMILFVTCIALAVTFVSGGSPIIACFGIGVALMSLMLVFKTAGKIGEAYDFGPAMGFVALILSSLIVALINVLVGYLITQAFGVALSDYITMLQ
jgi:hypothetical protein